jgi:hypothetical protein
LALEAAGCSLAAAEAAKEENGNHSKNCNSDDYENDC